MKLLRALELKLSPVLAALLCGALMWWLSRAVPASGPGGWPRPVLTLLLLAASAIVGLSALRAFRRASTTVNPFRPANSSALVVSGVFRYSRNPMYVGVLTTILGWAVLFETPGLVLYALCVGLCFHLFVVFYEEPHLERVFGGAYEDYRARVGRWIPRIGRLMKRRG